MSFMLIPNLRFRSIYDISPEFLKSRGIRLALLDLDNTISPYSRDYPDDKLLAWIQGLKNAGIVPFIVSNSKKPRPENFAAALEIPFIKRAKKPSIKGIERAMELCGKKPGETALIGDQIYTDTIAANRAGISSILVRPIEMKNPLLALRYVAELPFRALSRRGSRT